jgi:hypothetical protein
VLHDNAEAVPYPDQTFDLTNDHERPRARQPDGGRAESPAFHSPRVHSTREGGAWTGRLGRADHAAIFASDDGQGGRVPVDRVRDSRRVVPFPDWVNLASSFRAVMVTSGDSLSGADGARTR